MLESGGMIKGELLDASLKSPMPETHFFLKAYKAKNPYTTYMSRTDSLGKYTITGLKPSSSAFEFWAVDEKPELIHYVAPEYPKEARKAEIEGIIHLEVVVDATGYVVNVKVKKSLHPLCDNAAVKVAWKWKFEPAKIKGEPVPVKVIVPVHFTLEK